MRIQGTINSYLVIVLVDSGLSHNFLDPRVAHKVQAPVLEDTQFSVTVASGEKLTGSGKCEGINIKSQGVLFQSDFYLLDLPGFDAILGAQWLQTLGMSLGISPS
uniref:RVP_2 domain-containing protein n=1 Tax=Nelumbo nucifera TaxID=4432 RepID=A0A822YUH2_NELNU|nr:TPA_asm: hypothetical protein HUJ06_006963 [Nelumbo nucifera]